MSNVGSPIRTLALLRHAKSSWSTPGLPDEERPLTARGIRAARRMGAYMKSRDWIPELALCSSALRTRMTWEHVAEVLGTDVQTRIETELYAASPASVLQRLQRIPDSVSSVIVIGHNPTMHALALALSGQTSGPARSRLRAKYPTGALTVIRAEWTRWCDAGTPGQLEALVYPLDLDDELG